MNVGVGRGHVRPGGCVSITHGLSHFRLGLGTQVRTHIERRYGMQFDPPGPRLRDYVLAVKASFAAFRGEPLEHRGAFYELTWMSRQWSPGAIDVPDPNVLTAPASARRHSRR